MIFNHGKPDLEEMANEEMAEALDTFLESWEREKHDFELRQDEMRRQEEIVEEERREHYRAWIDRNS